MEVNNLQKIDIVEGDFEVEELDSVENVVGLRPNDPLNLFVEIWYQVFLWHLFSSIFVHVLAAGIAFCRLRKHKIGRFVPVGILVMGVLSPLLGGTVTSAAIAGVYRTASVVMAPLHSIFWGVGQTALVIIISFTRILATL